MLSLLIAGLLSMPTGQLPEKPFEPGQREVLDDALTFDLVRQEVVDGVRAFNRLVCLRPVDEDELGRMVVREWAVQQMLVAMGNDQTATIVGAETVLDRMTDAGW